MYYKSYVSGSYRAGDAGRFGMQLHELKVPESVAMTSAPRAGASRQVEQGLWQAVSVRTFLVACRGMSLPTEDYLHDNRELLLPCHVVTRPAT